MFLLNLYMMVWVMQQLFPYNLLRHLCLEIWDAQIPSNQIAY